MNRLILGLTLSLLVGCSFSRENSKSQSPPIIEEKIRVQSEAQKRVLLAVKNNDAAALRLAVADFRADDFSFNGFKETPAGLALKYNLIGILKMIPELRLSIADLGDEEAGFRSKYFRVKLREAFFSLNHSEASKIKDNYNEAEQILGSAYDDVIERVLAAGREGRLASAKALINSSEFDCSVFSSHLVLTAQKQNIEFSGIGDLLGTLPCQADSKQLQELYQLELVRQFRLKFKTPEILRYIAKQPTLVNPMWDIDGSGIWVSPKVLFRIAYSEENQNLGSPQEFECINLESVAVRDSSCAANVLETERVIKGLGLDTKYEIIVTQNGRPKHSFTDFPRVAASGEDVFYKKVSAYMRGIKLEQNDFWAIQYQLYEEGVPR